MTSRERPLKDRFQPWTEPLRNAAGFRQLARCYAAEPRDRKRPEEGGSRVCARRPAELEPGQRLVGPETQSRQDEGEDAEPEP